MLNPAVRRALDGTPVAHLASVLPDGSPHSVPLWVDTHGEQVVFLTGPGSRKARNLRRDPRVALSLTSPDNPFEPVIIRGRVVEWLDGRRRVGGSRPDRREVHRSAVPAGPRARRGHRRAGAADGRHELSGAWRAGVGHARLWPCPPPAARCWSGGGRSWPRRSGSSTPPPAARGARCSSPARRASASRGSRRAARAGRRGRMTVLVGRSVDGGGTYRAVTEALARLLRTRVALDDPALRPYRAALRRLLPGIADEPLASAPDTSAPDTTVMLGEGVLRCWPGSPRCSCWRTCTGPTRTRSTSCATSQARWSTRPCCWWRRPATTSRRPALARLATDVRTLAVAPPGRRRRGRAGGGLPRSAAVRGRARGAGRPRRRAAAAGRGAAGRRSDAGAAVDGGAGGGPAGRPAAVGAAGGARRRGGRRHRLAVAGCGRRPVRRWSRGDQRGRGGGGRGAAGGGGRRAARRRRRSAALPPRPHPRRRARHPAAPGARGAGRPGRPRARRARRPRARRPALPRVRRPGPGGRDPRRAGPRGRRAAAPCAAPPPSSTRRASTPRPPSACTC